MPGSNSKDCLRTQVGKRIIGVLFDALPLGRVDLRAGNKTFVFEDGTGFTFTSKGAFWEESASEVGRALAAKMAELDEHKRTMESVLELAGVHPTPSGDVTNEVR